MKNLTYLERQGILYIDGRGNGGEPMEKIRRMWLGEAVKQIRFVPDRKVVFEELAAHIQDRSDDLVTRGYTREEADERTLRAMGDPSEIGKQLDLVHKPWLGWLWMVSRWLAIFAVLVLLWCVLLSGMFSAWNSDRLVAQDYLDPETDVVQHSVYGEQNRILYWEGDGDTAKWNRYTFRIEKAAVWNNTTYDLYGHMTVSGFLPWEDYFYLDETYAVDSLGNYYQNFQSIYFDNALYEESGWKMLDMGWAYHRNLTTWWYGFFVNGLDPEAEWIELRYDRNGQNIVLRIDLTGGEGA